MAQGLSDRFEVLLVLMPWDLPGDLVRELKIKCPGIHIITYRVGFYDKVPPLEIPQATWDTVTALFTWMAFPTPEQAPKLQYVQLLTAGCNHVSTKPIFKNTEVVFCMANGVHPPQISEWVIATFLSFQRHLYEHWENQKRQMWVMPEHDEDTEDAVGLRMGVLGYGSIGRRCARLAKALGMDVYAYTARERSSAASRIDNSYVEPGLGDAAGDIPSRWFHGHGQLNDFLTEIDLLVVTLPLTPATKGIISKEQLQALGKRKGSLANVARGPVVDTDDLVTALNEGVIKGAALDVTDPEPLPSGHPLWKAKNLIITPHVSCNSTHCNERVLRILVQNLTRRAQGENMINVVDKILEY
ncbi:glyoxylate reductase [Colletotrichum incanum]|uniref:Glyoxylate reductase n=1 Tax=Colletotrichum incanum TaxID=1573173 RepID=A0A161W2L1_COLIC|nr:glyoxylate reductase [Colletotrichum incanum]OHW89978.1 d-isomer specific 2-hydroxyacid dehydrogenase [Colletotrichum incanum]